MQRRNPTLKSVLISAALTTSCASAINLAPAGKSNEVLVETRVTVSYCAHNNVLCKKVSDKRQVDLSTVREEPCQQSTPDALCSHNALKLKLDPESGIRPPSGFKASVLQEAATRDCNPSGALASFSNVEVVYSIRKREGSPGTIAGPSENELERNREMIDAREFCQRYGAKK